MFPFLSWLFQELELLLWYAHNIDCDMMIAGLPGDSAFWRFLPSEKVLLNYCGKRTFLPILGVFQVGAQVYDGITTLRLISVHHYWRPHGPSSEDLFQALQALREQKDSCLWLMTLDSKSITLKFTIVCNSNESTDRISFIITDMLKLVFQWDPYHVTYLVTTHPCLDR